jgi:hypothetical protein
MSALSQTRSFDDVGSMSGLPESGHDDWAIYEYTPWAMPSLRPCLPSGWPRDGVRSRERLDGGKLIAWNRGQQWTLVTSPQSQTGHIILPRSSYYQSRYDREGYHEWQVFRRVVAENRRRAP